MAGLTAPGARAGEPSKDEKRIEKRVLLRHAGGGFLGVGLGDVEGEARGAAVRSLEADGPAGKAGIKEGDVIVRFDGEAVRSAAQLVRMVGETPAGRSVAIEILRAGKPEKLTVTLGEGNRLFMREGMPGERGLHFALPVPPEPPDVSVENNMLHVRPREPRRLGVEFIDMGEQLAAAYKLEAKSGVLVASVEAGGAAAKAGIRAGDVLLEFDGHEIESGRDLRGAVADSEPGETVKVKLLRDSRPLELDVTMGGAEPKREQGPTL